MHRHSHHLHRHVHHRDDLTALVSLAHVALAQSANERVGAACRASAGGEAADTAGFGDDIS